MDSRFIPLIFLTALLLLPGTRAELAMDNIQFDPAIIASGDRVDIVVQFHEQSSSLSEERLGNPRYRFLVELQPDAPLTREYVLIEDSEGNDLQGIITKGAYYNKRFTVKVRDDAPAGDYEFRLIGRWYKDGQPLDGEEYLRFMMPVKKEGIALSVANVVSTPAEVRGGDKRVLLATSIANTGEKTAKNVRIKLDYPKGVSSSYTNNNELTIGTIENGQVRDLHLYVDTDRSLPEGVYSFGYRLTYQDSENNGYDETGTFPFVVKKKPHVIVTSSEGIGRAGDDLTLRVSVQNVGQETADSVDVRILKQSSQPFEMDVRSDYIGRLAPNETGMALFELHATREAEIKDHKLTVVIRAKGDSEEGDDNIYTYTDAVLVRIDGEQENPYPLYGGIFLALVIAITGVVAVTRRKGR